jgi:hypothetical protein
LSAGGKKERHGSRDMRRDPGAQRCEALSEPLLALALRKVKLGGAAPWVIDAGRPSCNSRRAG